MKLPVIKLRIIKHIALNIPMNNHKSVMYWCKVQGVGACKAWIASTCIICAKPAHPNNICNHCADRLTVRQYLLANRVFSLLIRAGNYTEKEAANITSDIIAHDGDEASSTNNYLSPLINNKGT